MDKFSEVDTLQQDLVEKWVSSVVPHNSVIASASSLDKKQLAEAEDELLLGAEAKLLHPGTVTTEETAKQNTDKGERVSGVSVLRSRFAQHHEDSFNSESSRHSSLEQLLSSHKVDPTHILTNLGFGSNNGKEPHRLPKRFLMQSSTALGISVKDYVESSKKLSTYVESRKNISVQSENSRLSTPNQDNVTEENRMKSFGRVANVVSIINRFRDRALYQNRPGHVEPVLRMMLCGKQYWSILEEENCSFLDKSGYYSNYSENYAVVNTVPRPATGSGGGWAALKSAAAGKKIRVPAIPATPSKSNELEPNSQSILRADRGDSNANGHNASVGTTRVEEVDRLAVADFDFGSISPSVPVRFLNHPPSLFPKVYSDEPPTALPVVGKGHDKNNNREGLAQKNSVTSDASGSEWYHSSSSSSSVVDEVESDRSYLLKLETMKAANLAAATDSVDSQLNDGSLPVIATAGEATRLRCHIQLPGERTEDASQEGRKENHALSALGLPSRMRCVLFRQGSSQSDSSGFADSEQADSSNESMFFISNKSFAQRALKQMKLTSRSFSTIDPSQSDEADDSFALRNQIQDVDILFDQLDVSADSHERGADSLDEFHSRDKCTQTSWCCGNYADDADNEFGADIGTLGNGGASAIIKSGDEADALTSDFRSSSEPAMTYTTSLYIDSVIPTMHVPLTEKSEVLLIINNDIAGTKLNDNTRHSSAVESTVDAGFYQTVISANVMNAANGTRVVAADYSSTIPVRLGGNAVYDRTDALDQTDELWNTAVMPLPEMPHDRHFLNVMDTTDHQILHSLMQSSPYVSPQTLACLTPPSEWLSDKTGSLNNSKILQEEVKLVQQALAKYRLELSALRMRARVHFSKVEESSSSVHRLHTDVLVDLQSQIMQEINSLDKLLAQRMRVIIGYRSNVGREVAYDVAGIPVLNQMITLVGEQLFHSNIISGMSVLLSNSHSQDVHESAEQVRAKPIVGSGAELSTSTQVDIAEKISSLEQRVVEWQLMSEHIMTNILHQVIKKEYESGNWIKRSLLAFLQTSLN